MNRKIIFLVLFVCSLNAKIDFVKDIMFGSRSIFEALEISQEMALAYYGPVIRNPEQRDSMGNTPLLLSAEKGYERLVSKLLVFQANMQATNVMQRNVLHCAVRSGNIKVVEQVLGKLKMLEWWRESEQENLNTPDCFKKTPLDYAREYKRSDIEKLVLGHLKGQQTVHVGGYVGGIGTKGLLDVP